MIWCNGEMTIITIISSCYTKSLIINYNTQLHHKLIKVRHTQVNFFLFQEYKKFITDFLDNVYIVQYICSSMQGEGKIR